MWQKRMKRWLRELFFMGIILLIASLLINAFRAPEIPDTTLQNFQAKTVDGKKISPESFRGHPTLLHFWGSWCPVCRSEMDNIERIAKHYPVISVAVTSKELRRYISDHNLRFPVIDDRDGVLAKRFGIGIFPTTLFVDGSGKIVFVETGYTTTPGLWIRLWYLAHFRE